MIDVLLLFLIFMITASVGLSLFSKNKKNKIRLFIVAALKLVTLLVINFVNKREVFIRENLFPVLVTGGILGLLIFISSRFEKEESSEKGG